MLYKMEENVQQNGVGNGVEEQPKTIAESTETPVDFLPDLPVQPAQVIIHGERGRFQKGSKANPSGRSRVTARKIEKLKGYMDLAIADNWPKYLKELQNLSGKDFLAEYRALLEFRFPKMQRLDSTILNIDVKEQDQQILKIGDNEIIL